MEQDENGKQHARVCICQCEDESKRQLRRRLRIFNRKDRKSKLRGDVRRTAQCVAQVASLGLEGTLEEMVQTLRVHFQQAPRTVSHPLKELSYAVEQLVDRPPRYQRKFAPQEASLLQQLYGMGMHEDVCVVDVGCGNGTLAILSALVFGCSALGIDMETPREELCAETYLRSAIRFRRIEKNIGDPSVVEDTLARMHDMQATRVAIVCKHLCGTGSDLCLKYIQQLQSHVEVIGCVIATCCYHKIVNDLATYETLHDIRSPYLDQICRWTTWKATALSDNNTMSPEHVACAVAFEDMIQAPRIRTLELLFANVAEVLFVPQKVSPHNRALVASRLSLQDGSWVTEGVDRALAALGQRLNLWPRGIVSKRFDGELDAHIQECPTAENAYPLATEIKVAA